MKSSDIRIGQHIIYLQRPHNRSYRAIERIPGEVVSQGKNNQWVNIRMTINNQPIIRAVKIHNLEVEEGAGAEDNE